MNKRYLDCSASELAAMGKKELLHAIRASEGRLLVSEVIGRAQPLLHSITNAELAASQGADMLLLNMFDVRQPVVQGMPSGVAPGEIVRELQWLTGRVIGANLEAVDPEPARQRDDTWKMTPGRAATAENACILADMGAKFVVLTGNPGNGVSNRAIAASLREIRDAVGDRLILVTGKMHGSGIAHESGSAILSERDIGEFAAGGADIVLLPAPGTVPGMSQEAVAALIRRARNLGTLAMTVVGTSQEGADSDTIRRIALMSKMAGADLHHLGDAGYLGVALPENIRDYGIVIRGIRHTYARMARSINR